jgi:hypothetical protein
MDETPKYKTSIIFPRKISLDDHNSLKSEMQYKLDEFKKDQKDYISQDKFPKDIEFRTTFFNSLDSLLKQVDIMKDEDLKSQKIKIVYKWYQSKMKFHNETQSITRRTAKYEYENFPTIDTSIKSEYYAAKHYPTHYERANRTEEDNADPPKDR